MSMKLLYSAASPYARKVRAVAQELGLAESIEVVPVTVTPVDLNAEVSQQNPLAKVPTLLLADGSALYDSRVIVDYLCSLVPTQTLLPETGALRWTVLRRQALCDGILDAALLARYEEFLRPAELRWTSWQAGQEGKILRGLAALEAECADFAATVRLDSVAVACTLGYLDLRFARLNWRTQAPQLAAFEAGFAQRASLRDTRPV